MITASDDEVNLRTVFGYIGIFILFFHFHGISGIVVNVESRFGLFVCTVETDIDLFDIVLFYNVIACGIFAVVI